MTAEAIPASDSISLEQLHQCVCALCSGDFEYRLPVPESPWRAKEIARSLNHHMARMQNMIAEIKRISDEVGTQGRFGGQAQHSFGSGPWADFMGCFNRMAEELTRQVRDIGTTARLVADGDTSRPITVPCAGETLELKSAVIAFADRVNAVGPSA